MACPSVVMRDLEPTRYQTFRDMSYVRINGLGLSENNIYVICHIILIKPVVCQGIREPVIPVTMIMG